MHRELPEELLIETLELLPVTVYAEPKDADQLPAARRLLSQQDEVDAALAALALALGFLICSRPPHC
ncbi:MAG TPA: hypothetical protein VJ276_11570 [Thermoanaerobaculia bacterium]|nr:hypothetical protein [Thermoanaerobaculia bacterium]